MFQKIMCEIYIWQVNTETSEIKIYPFCAKSFLKK